MAVFIRLVSAYFSAAIFGRDASMPVVFLSAPAGGALGFSSEVFIMDAVGGGDMNLGELADLTVANDNDLSMDVISASVFETRPPHCCAKR